MHPSDDAGPEMPRYQCHKVVGALKIAAIEFEVDGSAKIAPADPNCRTMNGTLRTKHGYRARFKGIDSDLGYYVLYADGYESWSPTNAFEEGYTRL